MPALQEFDVLILGAGAAGLMCAIEAVENLAHTFIVRTPSAEFRAKSLVVATGGLSIPKMGATSFGYELAKQFGLAMVEPYPALVPLTFNARDLKDYADLAGIST